MIATILGLLGVGGFGVACFLIPGLAQRVIEAARGLISIIADYPWQALCGALVAFSAWSWVAWGRDNTQNAERIATLTTWQNEAAAATRKAAHRPNLALNEVPKQIFYLGDALDRVKIAQIDARDRALAAKARQERENEDKRRSANHALPAAISENRRSAFAALEPFRLHNRSGSGRVDRGPDGRAHLPDPAFGTGQPDAAGSEAEFYAVSAEDLRICIENTTRLENAHAWAVGTLPPPQSQNRPAALQPITIENPGKADSQ